MKNLPLRSLANKLQNSRTAIFCLGAGFSYLLAGQPIKALAAFKENQEPKGRRQNIGKLLAELQSRCENKSVLDRLKSRTKTPNLLEADQPVVMAGTSDCPGTLIPAGTSFTDTGTTVGGNNTVNGIQAGCSNYTTVAGPDVIYQFRLPPLASRIPSCSITVTPTGGTGYDPAIYILNPTGAGCPSGTGNNVTNCQQGADVGSFNGAETITDAELDALPAGLYFLFIDSFYTAGSAGQPNRHNGPYTLSFNCTTVAPTAANVSVSGRVTSPNGGVGLGRISVSATDSNGQTFYATTNSLGFYKFESLPVGDTYIFQVASKKYQFSNPTQVVSVSDNIADLNFEAIE